MRPVGAHAPVAKGLGTGALRYAAAVRAEAIQVFVTNPRAWSPSPGQAGQTAALREHVAATGLPVFVHAPYLVNVASPDPELRARSAGMVRHCLRRGAEIGARGVVMHAGSAVSGTRADGLAAVAGTVLPLLDALPDDWPDLLIEPMAGTGGMVCATIAEIGPYLAALDWHPRARLCLDTCHLFAAGHDLAADGGTTAALAELTATAPGRLSLIHANDSMDGCGSRRDRHQNVGRGTLGRRPFWDLLHHPATEGVAFVVETPGDEAGQAADIRRLRRLRSASRPPAGRPPAGGPGPGRPDRAGVPASLRAAARPD
ncbi:MAG TPA: deoxyribonuclease IV [Streptosporangiaceae bacterium]